MKKRFFSAIIASVLLICEPCAAIRTFGSTYATREDFSVTIVKLFYAAPSGGELPFADTMLVKPENRRFLASLYNSGVLSGVLKDGQAYLEPQSPITRQEAVALLGRVLGVTSDFELEFTDSDSIAPYAREYVSWFAENGVVSGYPNGSFAPNGKMTENELMSLATRAHEYKRRGEVRVETFFGTGAGGREDGDASTASFLHPQSITAGADGMYVFDTYNNAIRKISDGKAASLTNTGSALDENRLPSGYFADGKLEQAYLNRPSFGTFNSKGQLIICDSRNNRIRYIADGEIHTLSGGEEGFADGQDAKFNCPSSLVIDENDNIYVTDTLNNCIRLISADGTVSTFAGNPKAEGFADGEAVSALFRAPSGIALKDGVIYVSDTGNHRIRKIENGIVSTFAGSTAEKDAEGAPFGGFKDGSSEKAMFNLPMGMAFAEDILVVADYGNNRLRAVTDTGYVVTVAGDGVPGDVNGYAAGSVLCRPSGVCYKDGILYVADTGNNKIKRLSFKAELMN